MAIYSLSSFRAPLNHKYKSEEHVQSNRQTSVTATKNEMDAHLQLAWEMILPD